MFQAESVLRVEVKSFGNWFLQSVSGPIGFPDLKSADRKYNRTQNLFRRDIQLIRELKNLLPHSQNEAKETYRELHIRLKSDNTIKPVSYTHLRAHETRH